MNEESTEACDVIIFSAHPDDAEMGMGGTMLRLVDAGYRVLSVALTQGQAGTYGSVETRRKEFEEASARIGCESLMLDFVDTEVENTPEARKRIARIIRRRKPKIIFTIYHTNPAGEMGGIAHVDHPETGSLVRDAVKYARLKNVMPELPAHQIQKLFFFLLPNQVRGNLVVDVSDVMDRLFEAIAAYETQMNVNFAGNDIEYILRTKRAATGLGIGAAYAEAFVTDVPLALSANAFFEV